MSTRWLAVHNVMLPVAGRVWGRAFRFGSARFVWEASDGNEFPKESIVQSGSEFEAELRPEKERDWLRRGAIAPLQSNLHYQLEDVFGEEYAKALRLSNIWTLEEVLAGKVGDVLLGDKFQKIGVATMLKQLAGGNDDRVSAWLDDARAIVQGAAPNPVRAEPEPPAPKRRRTKKERASETDATEE